MFDVFFLQVLSLALARTCQRGSEIGMTHLHLFFYFDFGVCSVVEYGGGVGD
jgi:hypothetical protein